MPLFCPTETKRRCKTRKPLIRNASATVHGLFFQFGRACGPRASPKLITLLGGTELARKVQQGTQCDPNPPVSSAIPETPQCLPPASSYPGPSDIGNELTDIMRLWFTARVRRVLFAEPFLRLRVSSP